MPALFTPYALKDVTLRNRIAVPPMCQYSAVDGIVTEWHLPHYVSLARGGAGLVIVEATAVSPEGRITPGCTGLWRDEQMPGLAAIAAAIGRSGAVPGIQIGHAGRRASSNRPWEGDDHIPEEAPGGWRTIAPSPVAYGAQLPRVPTEMSLGDVARVQADFVAAAGRARDAGFRWLELHFAHGFLAQSFFSRHSNRRADRYGGTAENRGRFLLETLAAVRRVWPERLPLTARFGVVEFDGRDEDTLPEAIALARGLREGGLDLLDVSLGFSTPEAKVPWGPAMLVPIAGRVGRESGLPVATSWGLDAPPDAERAVASGGISLAMMARAHLADPHYPFRAARELAVPDPASVLPDQYAYWLARYGRLDGTASAD